MLHGSGTSPQGHWAKGDKEHRAQINDKHSMVSTSPCTTGSLYGRTVPLFDACLDPDSFSITGALSYKIRASLAFGP